MTKQELETSLNRDDIFDSLNAKSAASLLGKVVFRINKIIYAYYDQARGLFTQPLVLKPGEIETNRVMAKKSTVYFTLDKSYFIPVIGDFDYSDAIIADLILLSSGDVISLQLSYDDENYGLILTVDSNSARIDPTDLDLSEDAILCIGFSQASDQPA